MLYYIKLGKGLWSMSVEGAEETSVLAIADAGHWEAADSGIYYLDPTRRSPDGGMPLILFRLPEGKPIQIASLPKLSGGNSQKLSVTHDGRWIAWEQLDYTDDPPQLNNLPHMDLMLIDNFR